MRGLSLLNVHEKSARAVHTVLCVCVCVHTVVCVSALDGKREAAKCICDHTKQMGVMEVQLFC